MGFRTTIEKWKANLNSKRSLSTSTSTSKPRNNSEEHPILRQLPLPPQPKSYSEAALHGPTSQIVCHSPLDKRNKAKKTKKSRKSEDSVATPTSPLSCTDGQSYTTSRVLFSSRQLDKVVVERESTDGVGDGIGNGSQRLSGSIDKK
jgi:hypothetical protein